MSVDHRSIYMIGHSTHPWSKFVDLLKLHKIDVLVDVRTKPQSRFSPQFNKKSMSANLEVAGIEYLPIPELGGKDPLPVDQLRAHTQRLLSGRPHQRLCLMCSEGNFRACHRHYLLAPFVIEFGHDVQQINPDGTLILDPGPTSATLKKMAKYLPSDHTGQMLLPSTL